MRHVEDNRIQFVPPECAKEPFRDNRTKVRAAGMRQSMAGTVIYDAGRKLIMDHTETGKVDFDTLYERVLANMPESWVLFARSASTGSPEVGA